MADDPSPDESASQAERSIADEAYRRLFESHPAPMAVWDPATGAILAANEAAARQYGYAQDELVGLTVGRIVHPEDLPRLREQVPNLPQGLAGAEAFRHVRRNGEVIEVEMSGHPLEWQGRPARLVMAIDVTSRRRLEQQLHAARAIEAVGRLAGGIAHDFNNLVMAINGFAELLLERLPAGSDERDAAVEIRTAGLRAAGLTSQMLAFAQPHEPKPERFDLNELVRSMETTVRSLSGPHVRVQIDATAAEAGIHADREQIARAIVGCVLYARDAMPDGGELRIETRDVPAASARQLAGAAGDVAYVALAVTDRGPTDAADDEDPLRVTRTGLGLTLVYATVQLAGGRIRLESSASHGSTVWILLPVAVPAGQDDIAAGDRFDSRAIVDTAPTATTTVPPQRSGAIEVPEPGQALVEDRSAADARRVPVERDGEVIAVVEDEPGVRSLVERILVRSGYRVLPFADGATALESLLGGPAEVDLLLTDLVMPGPSGFEVARRLRHERPDLPVLFMSGYAADALHTEGIAEGTVEILAKPFSAAELLERVAGVLATAAHGA